MARIVHSGSRTRRTADEWLALFEVQKSSGLSVGRFCSEKGISIPSFYAAKNRFGLKSAVLGSTSTISSRTETGNSSGPRCELVLKGGRRLVISADVNEVMLRKLIRLVESA